MNGLKRKELWGNANATKGKTMQFKDEGGFYTTKLTKDGQPIDPFELYEYGSLQTVTAYSMKEARLIANKLGLIATFV